MLPMTILSYWDGSIFRVYMLVSIYCCITSGRIPIPKIRNRQVWWVVWMMKIAPNM